MSDEATIMTAGTSVGATATAGIRPDAAERERARRLIQTALDRAVERGEVAGANVLVSRRGEELWYAQSGLRNIERGETMDRDTICRLYSQTKPVTGAAAMMLVERGIIDLGDPVSAYLPAFAGQRVVADGDDGALANDIPMDMAGTTGGRADDGARTVAALREPTIKDLLTMTSGLPYPDGGHEAGRLAGAVFDELDSRLGTPDAMGTVELANRLGACPLRFQPGSHWMYGTSADVMGAVIEVASGKRFGDFLRDEIFEPLGMADTAFYVPASKLGRLAAVYDRPDCPVLESNRVAPADRGPESLHEIATNHLGVEYVPDGDPAFQSGGAGLKSTLDDYMRFGRMLANGGEVDGVRLLRPSTVAMMTSNALHARHYPDFDEWQPGYGYNTFMRIMQEPGKSVMLNHVGEYGWDGWLGTYFDNDPSTGTTILLMMQLTNAGVTPLTRRVKNIVTSYLD